MLYGGTGPAAAWRLSSVENTGNDIGGNVGSNYFCSAAAFHVPMKFNYSWALSSFVRKESEYHKNWTADCFLNLQSGIKFCYRPDNAFAVDGIAGWGIADANVKDTLAWSSNYKTDYRNPGFFLGIGEWL